MPASSIPEMTSLATSGHLEIEFDFDGKVLTKFICPVTARPICDMLTVLENVHTHYQLHVISNLGSNGETRLN